MIQLKLNEQQFYYEVKAMTNTIWFVKQIAKVFSNFAKSGNSDYLDVVLSDKAALFW